MAVDPATTIPAFDTTLPTSSEFVSEGDDNIRMLKTVLKTTFPNLGGAWNASQTEANYIVGVTSSIQIQLNAKGAWAGQIWTGTHDYTGATITVPTVAQSDNSTNAASTAYVTAKAFAATLPVQTGNSGKYVKTDGTTASWSFITFSELTGKPTTVPGYGISDLTTGAGKVGYIAGAGGTVTQTNSKSDAVTLNKQSGKITMHNAALGAGSVVLFTFNNSQIGTNDLILPILDAGSISNTGNYRLWTAATSSGAAIIALENRSAGSLSEAVVIRFVVLSVATT
jgi:hypothetical protein